MSGAAGAAALVTDAIAAWQLERSAPLVVAIDGHGAAGKSTIAGAVAASLRATLVHMDDFFKEAGPHGPPLTPAADSAMAAYYDWGRLRQEALEPLVSGLGASFRAFDWETNRFLPDLVALQASGLIVLEGVSSTASALGDLVDRSVLVLTPRAERLERLRDRITADVWDEHWLAAERSFFASRPPSVFDLVVSGAASASAGASG